LVVFDAATLAQRALTGSAWTLLAPRIIEASTPHDALSLAAGEGATTSIAVTGATLGERRASTPRLLNTAWLVDSFRNRSSVDEAQMWRLGRCH
jgi:hypothetical protein